MEESRIHQENELKYGVIYVRRNPERVPWLESMTQAVEALASPLQIQWIKDDDQDGLLLSARRFNVGNLGRYATVSLHLNAYGEMGRQYMAVRGFFDALMGVLDDTGGDLVFDETDFSGPVAYTCESPLCEPIPMRYDAGMDFSMRSECITPPVKQSRDDAVMKYQKAKKRRGIGRLRKKDKFREDAESEVQASIVQECDVLYRSDECKDDLSIPTEAELLDHDEACEVDSLERSREEELEQIRNLIINYIATHHADPEEMIRILLRGKVIVGQPGHLLVNGDMKIVLPEYDEMELKMPAMCRALYILFMKLRREGKAGIVLKDICDYREDLANIYSLVKPGAREDLVKQYIDRICDGWTDSLNQTISKINRCIKNYITSEKMRRLYCIMGTPGKEYGIAIDPELLSLPAAVTM